MTVKLLDNNIRRKMRFYFLYFSKRLVHVGRNVVNDKKLFHNRCYNNQERAGQSNKISRVQSNRLYFSASQLQSELLCETYLSSFI